MIARGNNGGFFAAHYDWIVAAIGLLALVGGGAYYAISLGEDAEDAVAEVVGQTQGGRSSESGVKSVDLVSFSNAVSNIRSSSVKLLNFDEKKGSFLASERRILCSCGKAIGGGFEKCPSCGKMLEETIKKVAQANADTDGDGMPDAWEDDKKFNKSNAADANEDADGDGFTNLEEYKAGTDPHEKGSHPSYLESLKIVLPLKETYVPFVFRKANKIPNGWRLEFLDPKQKDDYGRMGAILTAKIGEEIATTGYVLKDYQEKSVKQKIQGTDGMTKSVDASEALVERKRDGKKIVLVIQQGKPKNVKFAPIDIQASLVYERGGTQTFDVVPGSEIALNGSKYRIVSIKAKGKGAEVCVENATDGKEKRTLTALE